jgi:RHS repeat-associated protein
MGFFLTEPMTETAAQRGRVHASRPARVRAKNRIGAPTTIRVLSSKYTDLETGLVMYPYRPYSPALGRWLVRDLIGEEGGLNLYGFIRNAAVHDVDPLGLSDCSCKAKWTVKPLGWETLTYDSRSGNVVATMRKVHITVEVTYDSKPVDLSGSMIRQQAVYMNVEVLRGPVSETLDDGSQSAVTGFWDQSEPQKNYGPVARFLVTFQTQRSLDLTDGLEPVPHPCKRISKVRWGYTVGVEGGKLLAAIWGPEELGTTE